MFVRQDFCSGRISKVIFICQGRVDRGEEIGSEASLNKRKLN